MPSRAKSSNKPSAGRKWYLELALPLPLRQTFTYVAKDLVPPVGGRAIVPFGRRHLTGYVVGISDEIGKDIEFDPADLRVIEEAVDAEPLVTEEILELTKWAAGYYSTSWGEMLKASLPSGINALIEIAYSPVVEMISDQDSLREEDRAILDMALEDPPLTIKDAAHEIGAKKAKAALDRLTRAGLLKKGHRISTGQTRVLTRKAAVLAEPEYEDSDKTRAGIIAFLKSRDAAVPLTEIMSELDCGASPIKTLERHGAVEILDLEINRDPFADNAVPRFERYELTNYQSKACLTIADAIESGEYKTFLLKGVTGSGKTEVYIRSMETALEQGKSALMMVPEIALTPVFSSQLRAVFGKDVAILHSALSGGERFDEWRRIRRGEARIVIGTRSSIFAPLENIGLIVVDEEHDSSYRQNEAPFYHARDIAVVRAKNAGAVTLLGSATPSLESYKNAREKKYELIEMPERISSRPLAEVEIIDMRQVFLETTSDTVVSPMLAKAVRETHAAGGQTMMLINRRGFSQLVLCRNCGNSIKCRNCDITLTFHRREQKLICHYCAHSIHVPDKCPECDSEFLYFIGEGSEQIEDIIEREFPELSVARIDRDTTRKKKSLETILRDFSEHRTDMLVGTQIIAKGHDFPNVRLVGVISVDTGLLIPEFRSAERTFQLLTQVAGRAGRGENPGRVLIQTFVPNHYAIQFAARQDYAGFYEHEISFRERFNFPPFVALGQIVFKHKDLHRAIAQANLMKKALRKVEEPGKFIIQGPAPSPLSRLRGEYRFQILIKSRNRNDLRTLVEMAVAEAEHTGCDVKSAHIEIDPLALL